MIDMSFLFPEIWRETVNSITVSRHFSQRDRRYAVPHEQHTTGLLHSSVAARPHNASTMENECFDIAENWSVASSNHPSDSVNFANEKESNGHNQ